MTWTSIQAHSYMRKWKLASSFSRTFLLVDDIYFALMAYWFVEANARFICMINYSRDRIALGWFHCMYLEHLICIWMLWTVFFQTWYDDRQHWTVQFKTNLSNFDLHSRPHLFEKTKTFALTLAYFLIGLGEIFFVALAICLLKSMLNLFSGSVFKGDNCT